MVIDEKQKDVKSVQAAETASESPDEPPSDRSDKFASDPPSDGGPSDQTHADAPLESTVGPEAQSDASAEVAPNISKGEPDPAAADPKSNENAGGGEPTAAPPGQRKRRPRPEQDDDLKRPTHHEILNRLLEKNEMILQLNRKNVQLEARQKALEDKRIRLVAEFENYRKRTRKEWELLKHQTKAEVFLEILDVVDDFERAFSAVGEKNDDFVQGIRLIYNNMLTTLGKSGVSKMKALHEPFDPNYHMAVAQLESEEVESNHVIEVIQDGYFLNDTVMRPAKVVIAK